ncbi:hypothetical protein ABZY36_16640 [Streptomyces sp. NPDC006627]|uniref:hypothetical protein n=1 Tax=Streptomyces sp. NPDC006627 TaxID=3154679 RepID=UPI0033A408BF
MTTAAAHVAPAPTPATAPAWTVWAAHALSLLALPVCVWRLPFAFGYAMGGAAPDPVWWNTPYVLGLSGLMTLWGPLLLALTFAYYRRRR